LTVSDGLLLSLADLRGFLRKVDSADGPDLDLVLVGGAAVQLLCNDGSRFTRDIDLLTDETLPQLRRVAAAAFPDVDINARSRMFEQNLPDDWRDHLRLVHEGRKRLRVFVPCPEDLAVMKLLRMGPKDEADIERLTQLAGFDRKRFHDGFLDVLGRAIGPRRLHAQSFVLAWNELFPEEPALDIDAVIAAAGEVRGTGGRP
jgi:hypothetical protein